MKHTTERQFSIQHIHERNFLKAFLIKEIDFDILEEH